MKNPDYQVYIKYADNTGAFLFFKGRVKWKLKTARKHLRDVIAKKVNLAMYQNVQYFALTLD